MNEKPEHDIPIGKAAMSIVWHIRRLAATAFSNPKVRYTSLAILGVFAIWLLWPNSNSETAELTQNYWMKLQEISIRSDNIGEPTSQELDEVIAFFENTRTTVKTYTEEINRLDTTGVDQDAVNYAARLAALGVRSQQSIDEIVFQLSRNKAFVENANSWTALGESLSLIHI